MTLISRVLGFVRDVVLARAFGVSGATDAFFVAFRIPNLLRRLFAEGSFAMAFVPVLSEIRKRGEAAELRRLIDAVAGTLLGVLLLVTAVGVLFAPALVTAFAPGFAQDAVQFDMASGMLRITFPYILFIALVAFCAAILNSFDRFAIPALTPVLLNIALISAALWLAPTFDVPIYALAWAVLVAGVAQLLMQVWALAGMGLIPRPRWGWKDSGVRRVVKLMIPTLLGSSAAQINILIDTIIATLITVGSVSWLYYSDRLLEFPLGVFGIALSTVILPTLSRHHAGADREAFSRTLDWALRTAGVIAIPAAIGLGLAAEPIIVTLFGYGEYTAHDVSMTAYSLMGYALGLPAFVAIKVIAPAYFSRQDARTPVRISLYAMGANVIMNVVFVWAMIKAGWVAPHMGLALSSSLAAYLNAGLLYAGIRRDGSYMPGTGWGKYGLQIGAAVVAMVALLVLWPADTLGMGQSAAVRAGMLLLLVGAAGATWFLALLIFGWRPRELLRH